METNNTNTTLTPFSSLLHPKQNLEIVKTLHNILLFLCPGWEEKEKEKKKEKTLGEEIVVHLDKVVQRVGGAILVGNLEKSWLSKFSGFCLLDPVYPPSPRAIEGAVEREGLTNVIHRMKDFDLLDHVSALFSLPYAESVSLSQWQIINELHMRGTEKILLALPFDLCQGLGDALFGSLSLQGSEQNEMVQNLMTLLFSLLPEKEIRGEKGIFIPII